MYSVVYILSMEVMSDEGLVQQVIDGEFQKFGTLVERYTPKITRYVQKFLRTTDEAQDVVQNIFIKAYVNIRSFDVQRKFSPWVYRIAHNECINEVQKRGKEKISSFEVFDLDVIAPYLHSPYTTDKDVQEKETKQEVESMLEKLSPKYREVLILYYLQDLDYKEISDVLRIPIATVGVRIKRAKEMARKNI